LHLVNDEQAQIDRMINEFGIESIDAESLKVDGYTVEAQIHARNKVSAARP